MTGSNFFYRGTGFLLLFFVFITSSYIANKEDTTITTYWRNGARKTEKVYNLKRFRDNAGHILTVLDKPIFEKYFDYLKGKEVSKEYFDFVYPTYNKQDSLEDIIKNKQGVSSNTITFRMGGNLSILFEFNLDDTTFYFYEKKDTVISGNNYLVKVFCKDSLQQQPKRFFYGAIRYDSEKIYVYNAAAGKDEVLFDLIAAFKKFDNELPILDATLKVVAGTSKAIKSGMEKTAAFSLGQIIMLMAR